MNGKFLLTQLDAMTEAGNAALAAAAGAAAAANGKAAAGLAYRETAFGGRLAAEVAAGPAPVGPMSHTGGIKIGDAAGSAAAAPVAGGGNKGKGAAAATAAAAAAANGEAADVAMMEADEDFARQLQAKLDAESRLLGSAADAKGPKGGRGRGGGGALQSASAAAAAAAYVQISEEEIADDYPLPAQYEKTEEEADELLLADEDAWDLAPEDLPRRLLKDFAIYNCEGFFASLELVPLWSGVTPQVELFASGVVEEDTGDWGVGGQAAAVEAAPADGAGGSGSGGAGGSGSGSGSSGAGGSGSGGSGSAPAAAAAGGGGRGGGGMRLYLSAIQEWCVEASADMIFLSLRTDVAWYRLVSPADKYAPWFGVVLKAARVSLAAIGMLSDQSRASKLSFADVCKKLAEVPEGTATHISPKVRGQQSKQITRDPHGLLVACSVGYLLPDAAGHLAAVLA